MCVQTHEGALGKLTHQLSAKIDQVACIDTWKWPYIGWGMLEPYTSLSAILKYHFEW